MSQKLVGFGANHLPQMVSKLSKVPTVSNVPRASTFPQVSSVIEQRVSLSSGNWTDVAALRV